MIYPKRWGGGKVAFVPAGNHPLIDSWLSYFMSPTVACVAGMLIVGQKSTFTSTSARVKIFLSHTKLIATLSPTFDGTFTMVS